MSRHCNRPIGDTNEPDDRHPKHQSARPRLARHPGLRLVRPGAIHEGQPAFAVHAADGTLVAMMATRIAAEVLVRNNDLELVSVH